ncbi:hypothetical protein Tco_0332064 [Tanacetum coccineum]
MSSFGVKERRFLGYIVTEEGLRADPGRIQAIILSPTPRSPNQIRSLFLQLTAISKFILKLAELKHPLHNKLCAIGREGGNPDTHFLCKPTAARNGNMLHLNRKRVQALIHTARSLRTVFRKHKVKVVTNGPMEETLKISRREGRLGKWATEIPYDISYVQRKEVEGSVIRKFFSHGEQVEKIPNANKEGTLNLSMELYTKSNPMTRA